jgi:signal transduction histidine kinase
MALAAAVTESNRPSAAKSTPRGTLNHPLRQLPHDIDKKPVYRNPRGRNLSITDSSELLVAQSGRDPAEQQSQAKDEFMTMLAHELRKPTASVWCCYTEAVTDEFRTSTLRALVVCRSAQYAQRLSFDATQPTHHSIRDFSRPLAVRILDNETTLHHNLTCRINFRYCVSELARSFKLMLNVK